ncbi:hypothetical protein MJA45_14510 [Paenibacillus aurantius]|uniref:Lipoprotein n=1 Tax=Paenibacillus aurantius TaxID=2918900 RepID=A0AA96RFE6_9BACL|nr:hypothetical protein [Paenibacillus aurantius]WNQ08864.1 hypothetical protein MJA45_14510 [Paenibacillus aurantius]
MKPFLSFLVLLLTLTGCMPSEKSRSVDDSLAIATHNPTAEEVLDQSPDADLFQFNGFVYLNAREVEWVQQSEWTIGSKVGTIAERYRSSFPFEEGMATRLPVGTELYESRERAATILIAKADGKQICYLKMVEG